jgi:hypothetical protein
MYQDYVAFTYDVHSTGPGSPSLLHDFNLSPLITLAHGNSKPSRECVENGARVREPENERARVEEVGVACACAKPERMKERKQRGGMRVQQCRRKRVLQICVRNQPTDLFDTAMQAAYGYIFRERAQ